MQLRLAGPAGARVFGSVDYYRTKHKGYRAHSRALKIIAVLSNRDGHRGIAYDHIVYSFYMD
jgi:hypothetical protein